MDDGLKKRHINIHEQNVIHIVDNSFLTDSVTFSGSIQLGWSFFFPPRTILLGIWPE
jgi:hypothetical protein